MYSAPGSSSENGRRVRVRDERGSRASVRIARRCRAIRVDDRSGARLTATHELGRPHDGGPPYELHSLDHGRAWCNRSWSVARRFRREASTHARDDLVERLLACRRRRRGSSCWRSGRRVRRGCRRHRLRARLSCLVRGILPRLRRNGRRLRREDVASHRDESEQQRERPE